jgi:endonuclease/exonuclease/phosphatase family metal-dependent hydrolase
MTRLAVILLLIASSLNAQTLLRVLSYNIHHGEGMDGRIDLERIARVISSVEPDIVALQEVDVRAQRSGGVDQALELARLAGMHVLYGATMPYQGGQYGNALLSRWPAAEFRNHALPVTPGREPRAILDARFAHPFTGRILATHLDITRPDRMSAVQALESIMPPSGATPAILLGDLNDTPDSPVLEGLRAQGWVSAVEGPTVPVKQPKRQIDFILYRPESRWRVLEQRVLDEPVASDHLPIFAVLELKMPQTR